MISQEKAEYLKSLSSADGFIDPEAIVALARDPANLLHDEFAWDDSVAGHRWRVEQARRLVRFVKFEYTAERRTVIAPYYTPDPNRPPKSRRMVALNTVRHDTETARAILKAELDRVAAQLNRAREVAAVLGLTDELESAVERVVALQHSAEVAALARAPRRAARRARGR